MEPTREEVAYHEAAHAVFRLITGYPLECVTIRPNEETQSLGETRGRILPVSVTSSRLADRAEFTRQEIDAIRDNVTNLLAGEIAEANLYRRQYRLDSLKEEKHTRDEEWALGQLQSVYGNGTDYSEADRQLSELTHRAEDFVKQHWNFIHVVADELLKRTCLNDTDVKALQPKPPPPG